MDLNNFWSFFWLILEVFLLFVYIVLFFMIAQDIFRDSKMGGWAKAIWVLFLIIFPFVTAFVYLIARGNGMERRRREAAVAAQRAVDSYIRETANGNPAHVIAEANTLFQQGVITKEEFDQLQARALA